MVRQLSIFDFLEFPEKFQTPPKATQAKASEETYLHIDGDLPPDLPNGVFVSLKRKPPLKIYSLGFQPAKSIPEIPRWFLHKYGVLPFTVLEPFAGSGTTILESIAYGASVHWLDYNPLSRLICQVKTTQFDYTQVIQEASKLINQARHQTNAPETIKFRNKDFWFQKPVQEALEILRECIFKADNSIQPILWLVFSLTVRKASDMNDSMILAAKRVHIEKIPKRSREDVFNYFEIYLDKAVEAVTEWQLFIKKTSALACQLPAKSVQKISGDWVWDAVITSPPYINAIDYIWASKFELHWLGMVENDRDRLQLYTQEIGTERIPREECKELGVTGNQYLDNLIKDIYKGSKYQASKGQNQLRARVVYKYFIDMKKHLDNIYHRLKNGGYYCFAIGDVSKICGVDIPVASLLTQLASEVGFSHDFSFHLLLRNRKLNVPRNLSWAGTIKHDTIIVLKK